MPALAGKQTTANHYTRTSIFVGSTK